MTKRIASVIHVAVAIAALLYCTLRAQKVYSVKYRDRSDVTVYVTDYPSQADLLVYRVKYRDRAGDKMVGGISQNILTGRIRKYSLKNTPQGQT